PDRLAVEGERNQAYDLERDADADAEQRQTLEEARSGRQPRNLHSRSIVQIATPNLADFQGCHLFRLLAGPRLDIPRSRVRRSLVTSCPDRGSRPAQGTLQDWRERLS